MSKQKIKLEQCYRCKEQKDTLKINNVLRKKILNARIAKEILNELILEN